MHPYNYGFFDYLKDLLLHGDKTLASLVILLFSVIPFVCVLVISAVNINVSNVVINCSIGFVFFGLGFLGVFSMMRSKESTGSRKILTILFGGFIMLLCWSISLFWMYQIFFESNS